MKLIILGNAKSLKINSSNGKTHLQRVGKLNGTKNIRLIYNKSGYKSLILL
jgi:hypothetical protein